MEIHEYLVLKYDGKIEHFPVLDGDVVQAKIRATLCQRPSDCLVAVTDDAYIQLGPGGLAEQPRQNGARMTLPSGH